MPFSFASKNLSSTAELSLLDMAVDPLCHQILIIDREGMIDDVRYISRVICAKNACLLQLLMYVLHKQFIFSHTIA